MHLDENLIKFKKIEKELRLRRIKNKIFYYNTGKKIHKKQVEFHKCEKRNRWVFGGNRSGKTECGAVEVVYLARGIQPFKENKKNTSGWVVSLSTQVQRDVAQAKILEYLNPDWIENVVMHEGSKNSIKEGVIDYVLVKSVLGGTSKIGFKSCDQGREKFQGTSLDYVWFDEEPPKEIYDECKMRVLDKCGEIFGTMTPLKGLTFVYDEIYLNEKNDKEVWCEFMEWGDNPFLNKDEVEKLTNTMSEEELESRRYGKFRSSSGLVYKEFNENVHVIEPFDVPKEWFDKISIDPGLNNPLSAHFYACDYDGNVYVVAEHYEAGQDVAHHSRKLKEIAARLSWPKNRNGMIEALIDSAATQRTLSASKSVCELFYDNGILTNSNVNKDIFSGINRVKSYLKSCDGISRLFIFSSCLNLIREIKGYFWGNDDVPKKRDDHALDELRYYIMNKPIKLETKKEKSEVEKDKERLIRKMKNRLN